MGHVHWSDEVYGSAWLYGTVTGPKDHEPAPIGAGSQVLEKVVKRKWLGD